MRTLHADVVVLGAGFAGSLMALVLQRIGKRPALIDRGEHPRFAIGESSTPVANLALAHLAERFDLPRLRPLAKYGSWIKTYPHIQRGLKRGFSFYQHHLGESFHPELDHGNELLVAASPDEDSGDTHWFREDVDEFFVKEVQAAGIPYWDQTQIETIDRDGSWRLSGARLNEPVQIQADFLIDATGPAGLLCSQLGIPNSTQGLRTNSRAVFSHFTGVRKWEDYLRSQSADVSAYPFHCDNAALHHTFPDGWMWQLRFDHGITSAGFVLQDSLNDETTSLLAEAEWKRWLQRLPSVAWQFDEAEAIRPLTATSRLQRRTSEAVGDGWALLPHAAYFIDPLLSAGNAHSILGIERLAELLADSDNREQLNAGLARYQTQLIDEIAFVDHLVHGAYCTFDRFELLAPFLMYYFTGAIQSEARRRRGSASCWDGFLFSDEVPFRRSFENAYQRLTNNNTASADMDAFFQHVAQEIAPWNIAGLCDAKRCNLYPFIEELPA